MHVSKTISSETISWKRLLASVHDALMAGASLLIALGGRYGFERALWLDTLPVYVGSFVAISAIVFRVFGLGRGMWRFASVTDLRAIVLASAVSILLFTMAGFLVTRLEALPRTVPFITFFVMIVLIGAPRLAYRALKDGGFAHLRPRDMSKGTAEQVIIIGTATQADSVIRTYGLENARRYNVRGIVDLTASKRGRFVRGVPIIGEVSELDDILARLSRGGVTIDAAVIAAPRHDPVQLRAVAHTAARLRLPLRRVAPAQLTGGEPDLASITLEDLLGRPAVSLDLDRISSLIADRVVVVTGAGGSIGSEIARQAAAFRPARLVLVDSSEYALYTIDRAIAEAASAVDRRAVIADVRDRARMHDLLREERPSLVFHAAALKHVPLVEENVCEGLLTNAVGSVNLADAAVATDVDALVLISTDKAINPTSVMGASKRVAEAYCQALDVSGVRTRFITVRFGNVLGSTGSVVPLFKRQIAAGGPVTVTHPEMRRYFMTIKEATELVLQAASAAISRTDQRGRIFVLDMGEPVRIVDLARTMIALAGLRPDKDVPIAFTGLRSGEKLFEELFDGAEAPTPSGVDGVFVASARMAALEQIRPRVESLERAARAGDADTALALLARLVPELRRSGPAAVPAACVEPPTPAVAGAATIGARGTSTF